MDWHDPNNVIKHNVAETKKAGENKSVKKKEILNDKDADKAIREALGLDD